MRGLCLRAGDESNSLLLLDAPVQKPEPGFGSGVEATLTQRVSLQITDSTLIQLSIHCPNLQALVSLSGGDPFHPSLQEPVFPSRQVPSFWVPGLELLWAHVADRASECYCLH